MDFVSLWLSAIITSRKRSPLRLSLAASVGALYGVISVILSITGALSYLFGIITSLIMCFCAFGKLGSLFAFLRQSALLWACGALLGGVMTALLSMGNGAYTDTQISSSGGYTALICAVSVSAVYLAVRAICTSKDAKSAVVCAVWHDREVSFRALCDSGNLMRDPISGDPVIPLSREIAKKLCTKKLCDEMIAFDTDALARERINLRIIPHRTENEDGIIAGFVPDCVYISVGRKRHRVQCILAPRDCPKDYFAGYGATIPTSLLP